MTRGTLIKWSSSLNRRHGVRVYRVSGILTDTSEAFEFVDQIRRDLHLEPLPVLLDLKDVKRVTSAGVGLIATIFASAKKADQMVALCGLSSPVAQVLEMVHMNLVLAIFKNANEAFHAASQPGWARNPLIRPTDPQ